MHFQYVLILRIQKRLLKTVKLIAPVFGGINLEDIKAPECFYIEERFKERLIFLYFMMINMELLL